MLLVRKNRRRFKVEVEVTEDQTVIESALESEESKVAMLDDESLVKSSPLLSKMADSKSNRRF